MPIRSQSPPLAQSPLLPQSALLPPTQPSARRPGRPGPDDGGVWIMTGVALGLLAYAGVVIMVMAGFTAALPVVVVPLVLVGLIGASNLLGGGRTHGRTAGRPVGGGQAPLSSSGQNGPVAEFTPEGPVPQEGATASGDEP